MITTYIVAATPTKVRFFSVNGPAQDLVDKLKDLEEKYAEEEHKNKKLPEEERLSGSPWTWEAVRVELDAAVKQHADSIVALHVFENGPAAIVCRSGGEWSSKNPLHLSAGTQMPTTLACEVIHNLGTSNPGTDALSVRLTRAVAQLLMNRAEHHRSATFDAALTAGDLVAVVGAGDAEPENSNEELWWEAGNYRSNAPSVEAVELAAVHPIFAIDVDEIEANIALVHSVSEGKLSPPPATPKAVQQTCERALVRGDLKDKAKLAAWAESAKKLSNPVAPKEKPKRGVDTLNIRVKLNDKYATQGAGLVLLIRKTGSATWRVPHWTKGGKVVPLRVAYEVDPQPNEAAYYALITYHHHRPLGGDQTPPLAWLTDPSGNSEEIELGWERPDKGCPVLQYGTSYDVAVVAVPAERIDSTTPTELTTLASGQFATDTFKRTVDVGAPPIVSEAFTTNGKPSSGSRKSESVHFVIEDMLKLGLIKPTDSDLDGVRQARRVLLAPKEGITTKFGIAPVPHAVAEAQSGGLELARSLLRKHLAGEPIEDAFVGRDVKSTRTDLLSGTSNDLNADKAYLPTAWLELTSSVHKAKNELSGSPMFGKTERLFEVAVEKLCEKPSLTLTATGYALEISIQPKAPIDLLRSYRAIRLYARDWKFVGHPFEQSDGDNKLEAQTKLAPRRLVREVSIVDFLKKTTSGVLSTQPPPPIVDEALAAKNLPSAAFYEAEIVHRYEAIATKLSIDGTKGKFESRPSTVVITSPKSGSIHYADHIIVRGLAAPGDEVTVTSDAPEDHNAWAQSDGRWFCRVPLAKSAALVAKVDASSSAVSVTRVGDPASALQFTVFVAPKQTVEPGVTRAISTEREIRVRVLHAIPNEQQAWLFVDDGETCTCTGSRDEPGFAVSSLFPGLHEFRLRLTGPDSQIVSETIGMFAIPNDNTSEQELQPISCSSKPAPSRNPKAPHMRATVPLMHGGGVLFFAHERAYARGINEKVWLKIEKAGRDPLEKTKKAPAAPSSGWTRLVPFGYGFSDDNFTTTGYLLERPPGHGNTFFDYRIRRTDMALVDTTKFPPADENDVLGSARFGLDFSDASVDWNQEANGLGRHTVFVRTTRARDSLGAYRESVAQKLESASQVDGRRIRLEFDGGPDGNAEAAKGIGEIEKLTFSGLVKWATGEPPENLPEDLKSVRLRIIGISDWQQAPVAGSGPTKQSSAEAE